MKDWIKRLIEWAFPERDGIADLRPGLGKLVKRAIAEGATPDEAWSIELNGCKIRGERVGDWLVVVRPILRDHEMGGRS